MIVYINEKETAKHTKSTIQKCEFKLHHSSTITIIDAHISYVTRMTTLREIHLFSLQNSSSGFQHSN